MEFGICLQSAIAVRSEPAHRAEMVNQLLFGEFFRISGINGEWCHGQCVYDGYEGWVHQLQLQFLTKEEFIGLQQKNTPVTLDLVQLLINEKRNEMIPVLLGSSLPGYQDEQLVICDEMLRFEGAVSESNSSSDPLLQKDEEKIRYHLRENALLYLNAPYLWGGRSPFGIDCSGFTQMIYKLQNIQLLRDASQQATQGEVISLLFEAVTGDLAFFDNDEGQISHVGMIMGQNLIIHCSGKVRIDHLDQEGIFNRETGKYTHKLRLIKRMY